MIQDNLRDEIQLTLKRHGINSFRWTEIEGEVEITFDKAIQLVATKQQSKNIVEIEEPKPKSVPVQQLPSEQGRRFFRRPKKQKQEDASSNDSVESNENTSKEPMETNEISVEKADMGDNRSNSRGRSLSTLVTAEDLYKAKQKKESRITEV